MSYEAMMRRYEYDDAPVTRAEFIAAVQLDYPNEAHTLFQPEHDPADDDGPCFCMECIEAAS